MTEETKASDVQVIEQAVRNNWNIPDQFFEKMPLAMGAMILNPKLRSRTKIAAARVILQMNAQNQANDPAPQKHDHTHSFDWGKLYGRSERPNPVEVEIQKVSGGDNRPD